MELKEKIIKKIEQNKISTTEVADILGKKGALKSILPLTPRHFRVGEVVFVYAYNESNWEVHEQIANLDIENKIVYVHAINCSDRAIFGDLVSKYLFLYKRCKAVVVNAPMRDAHTLIKENYPIWCTGVTPIGCVNVKNESSPPKDELDALREKFDNGIMVCDDSGVVLIEKSQISEDIVEKLDFIELQEDVWYFCMDTHKMSTYDVVCLKKYLSVEGLIDKEKLLKLSKLPIAK
jgi:4-hydroxy-4-methyl-2-oxoglutarate aldolase